MKDLARWFQEEYVTSNACVAIKQDKWAREFNGKRIVPDDPLDATIKHVSVPCIRG